MTAVINEEMSNDNGVLEDMSNVNENLQGGKKKRKRSKKRSHSIKKGGTKKKGTKKKGTKKGGTKKKGTKKGPSKWIMHVKAFCIKTGKNFPQALKDPLCKKTFKH
jgi:hypothetical protein